MTMRRKREREREDACAYVCTRVCVEVYLILTSNVHLPNENWMNTNACRDTHTHTHTHTRIYTHSHTHTHKNYLKYNCPECCFICYEYYCQSTYVRFYQTERNFLCYCRRLTYFLTTNMHWNIFSLCGKSTEANSIINTLRSIKLY